MSTPDDAGVLPQWELTTRATASGKALFTCTGCGAEDPAPTKRHECAPAVVSPAPDGDRDRNPGGSSQRPRQGRRDTSAPTDIAMIREKVRNRPRRSPTTGDYTPPRYDDVFDLGVDCLDQQSEDPIIEQVLDLTFDDSI